MIELSFDTDTVRYPVLSYSEENVPSFDTAVQAKGRFQDRAFIFRGPDGELAQADATLHQAPQGTAVGDKIVVASVGYRVQVVELKTDPLFGHRHERLVLARWADEA
jgi:hypothetical protein